ncbi:GNAT family N-acetyltransferase [Phycicoccus sp. CMS6Z-2]|uniref:GNAT family N-acetyltransferase n=1 Tax=Phycicoccus flavus TaxID=2502783 RepID=UPI000FEC156D|nr:GNAT family N-acetyltransferase [Phycicoccus flavus]NHA68731.1 GNAT family N-acetyltransferase [Phycicoccus flavus]
MRHRLPVPDPRSGATLTDAVGDLVHVDDEHLVVQTRHGENGIARADVVAVKEVPPTPSRRGAPHRALSAADLQRVMVGAWPPVESEHLGGWLLRASGGFTQRANSVMTAGDPARPLPAALEEAEAWYARRGLPPAVTVFGPVGLTAGADPLGALLLERGYAPRVTTTTYTAAVAEVADSVAATPTAGPEVTTTTALDDDWFAAYTRYREAPEQWARAVLTGSPEQVFAAVRDGGEVLALGRLGVAATWGGVAAMWTAPEARRRGLATAVLGALARAARERGVRSVHLQTDDDNDGAVAVYRRHGFAPHHAYVTLRRPGRGPGPRPAAQPARGLVQVTSSWGS